jgi:hypothetical protein
MLLYVGKKVIRHPEPFMSNVAINDELMLSELGVKVPLIFFYLRHQLGTNKAEQLQRFVVGRLNRAKSALDRTRLSETDFDSDSGPPGADEINDTVPGRPIGKFA